MHYFIDGYNLLFRVTKANEELERNRNAFIRDLSEKVTLLHIDATLVFDSQFQPGEISRSHVNRLEVIYTNEGETADDCILRLLAATANPFNETIVTSDKRLAWRARRKGAKSETVERFVKEIERRWLNRQSKPMKRLLPAVEKPKLERPLIRVQEKEKREKGTIDFYLDEFEREFLKLEEEDREEARGKRVNEVQEGEKQTVRKKKEPKSREMSQKELFYYYLKKFQDGGVEE